MKKIKRQTAAPALETGSGQMPEVLETLPKAESPAKEEKKEKKKESRKMTRAQALEEIKTFLIRLVLVIGVLYVMFGMIFGFTQMPNDAMAPSIGAGDLLLYYRMQQTYANSDVVVYEADGQTRVGRIVAAGGDTVEITEDAQLKVNGSVVYEDDIYYNTPAYDSEVTYPLTLGSDEFFVLGDHRENAEDSRWFGPVARDQITGKVITVIRRNDI